MSNISLGVFCTVYKVYLIEYLGVSKMADAIKVLAGTCQRKYCFVLFLSLMLPSNYNRYLMALVSNRLDINVHFLAMCIFLIA